MTGARSGIGGQNKNAAGLEVLTALSSTLATSCPLPIGNRVNLLPSCTYARGGSHRCQAILTSAAVMYKALSFVQRSGRHAPDSTRTRMATRSAPTGLTVPPIPSTTSSGLLPPGRVGFNRQGDQERA